MNKYLIDTQVFIWWMEESGRLKKGIKDILLNPQEIIILSAASVWEMVIKIKIGRLKLPHDWKDTLHKSRLEILPINLQHIYAVETLPLYHKDPFDRILIAQAKVEGCTLITEDPKIKRYKIPVIG
ncbi:MAG: PilT protein domain protein [Candidatus Woesebacteria bacterium GW2011_GWB1_38_8]|uniref:PilT protein domain protein n=2 Tax=Candidatus Woeseibacteriota TaxID=1752722 RepID=A0A0G0L0U4_9BACT|nr:MAG: PilT protein domain protein [Candidatus Woesebacteria bacterium GW2011_GWB1_38_8]OGM20907.1 MAG: hypothetical protein A2863_03320 [Candidatus Woesebacteria bacterium RIFCSPHIGHO2_01_FULL_38_9b]